MSNIIPPLLSNSPPPPPTLIEDEEEDDEFGDFTTGGFNSVVSFDDNSDNFSPPISNIPIAPTKNLSQNMINKDSSLNQPLSTLDIEKDYCDKRKIVNNENSDNQIENAKLDIISKLKLENGVNETTCDKINTFSDHIDGNNYELDKSVVDTLKKIDDLTIINNLDISENAISSFSPLDTATHNDMDSNDENSSENCDKIVNNCYSNSSFENFPDKEKSDVTVLEDDVNEFYSFDDKSFSESSEKNRSEPTENLNSSKDPLSDGGLTMDDDDFGEFISENNDFGNFSVAFEAATVTTDLSKEEHKEPVLSLPVDTNTISSDNDDDDDFGDFESTFVPETSSIILDKPEEVKYSLNRQEALEKSDSLFKEIFTNNNEIRMENESLAIKNNGDDDEDMSVKNDEIFHQVKDVTDTHALSFHWSKSTCQNLLLKALNIDARNVLFGPGWNPSMPRFAANLSTVPLQPIKTEPTINSAPSIIVPPEPIAKTSAGPSDQSSNNMANAPVDDGNHYDHIKVTQLLETPSLHLHHHELHYHNLETLSVPKKSFSMSANNVFDNNWDIWLQSREAANKSHETGQLLKMVITPSSAKEKPRRKISSTASIPNDDFDDFVSPAQPVSVTPAITTTSTTTMPHNILLRETHISNNIGGNRLISQNNGGCTGASNGGGATTSEIVGISWLEPTIVTPELSRKEHQFSVDPELEEFDDYQIIIPPDESSVSKDKNAIMVDPVELEPPVKEMAKITSNDDNDDFGDFTFSLPKDNKTNVDIEQEMVLSSVLNPPVHSINTISPLSSTQPISAAILNTTPTHFIKPTPVLEPLKPSVIGGPSSSVGYSYNDVAMSQTISWPDPGITEDEIKRFESLTYSRVTAAAKNNELEKARNKVKSVKKSPSEDDSGWSDFVSMKKTSSAAAVGGSPVHKLKNELPVRSYSPDLPLSVLNLSNIQPAKQPVPVITPNGLVQTKLSTMQQQQQQQNSCLSLNLPNFPTNNYHHNRNYGGGAGTVMGNHHEISNNHHHHNFHYQSPSIISNQYANQAYGNFSLKSSNHTGKNADVDDDEWSDFVSHQPQSKSTIIAKPNYNNDSNKARKQLNSTPTTTNSINLPDLDFFMPTLRSRGHRTNNK